MSDIVKLEQRVKAAKRAQSRAYENRKVRLREHYHYARDKGFSAADAQILSFHSKEEIDQLARMRGE